MAKLAIIFNTSQNEKTYRYEIDQLKVVDWNVVLGCCLWNSCLKDQDMSFYVGMPAYKVYEEIKELAEKELWAEVYKIGKPFSSKIIKSKTIEEYGESAIKSYMNTLNADNLCCVIANGKAKDIMQKISDLINDKDNFDSGYDIRRICMFGNKDNYIKFVEEKMTFIPCNNSYAFYNMEDYYDELGFEVQDDYKLYEGKRTVRKSLNESYDVFETLEDAWDRSTLNNNVFEKTVLKLATDKFKDKRSTIYMFTDGSSLDCESLDPFDCDWCTYVSEDLSFVYKFRK